MTTGRPLSGGSALSEDGRDTLVGVAQVVYPSAVTGIDTFVRTFIDGRASRRPTHAEAIDASLCS